jgi:methoxymalonate biosynthesis acyl carrier protein
MQASSAGKRDEVFSSTKKGRNPVIAENETEIRTSVKKFIFASTSIPGLDDDDNLFESGIVNSLFAIQLMTFLEKTFGIEVTMDDLDIDNFKSIAACASFVSRKLPCKVS